MATYVAALLGRGQGSAVLLPCRSDWGVREKMYHTHIVAVNAESVDADRLLASTDSLSCVCFESPRGASLGTGPHAR